MSATPKKLTAVQITSKLKKFPQWDISDSKKALTRTFEVKNFISGLAFIAKIAVHAEILNHHPDITLSYTKVKVSISTHELKGLSKLDFDLVEKIEGLKLS